MSVNHVHPDPGPRLVDGKILADLLAAKGLDYRASMTATVSGDNTNSIALLGGINEVTVSANDTDGALLPPAEAGSVVFFHNADSAQDVTVFGRGSDTINGTAGSTGVAIGQGLTAIFICPRATIWYAGALSNTLA